MLNDYIKVSYECYSTYYSISKKLDELGKLPTLSFDIETRSIYSLEERAEAKLLLKEHIDDLSAEDIRLCKLVGNSSGLSHPTITKSTHLLFGTSESTAIIFIANSEREESLVFNWVVNYSGKLLLWNAQFDLKIVHERTGKFPVDFEDGQLLAKCSINHCDIWKAKVGLKELLSEYYDPKWTLIDTYDIQDYKDKAFLRYCAIDAAATFKGWQLQQEDN